MIILHFAPFSDRAVGGPRTAIPSLAKAQDATPGVKCALVMTDPRGRFEEPIGLPVFHFEDIEKSGHIEALPAPFNNPDLLVFHGTYLRANIKTARWARLKGIPYIIVPRGGLTRTAQSIKRWKKIPANLLGFRRYVAGAASVQFLTAAEATNSGNWGSDSYILGNGIQIPEKCSVLTRGTSDEIRFIYVGRIDSHIKGLDLLIGAISLASDELKSHQAKVTLYGPDIDKSQSRLEHSIAQYGVGNLVEFGGVIVGDEKTKALDSADIFVQTSRSEGHPSSVLEAMSFGLPCLLTPGTNMADQIAEARAGWRAEASAKSIANGLSLAMNNKPYLAQLGQNARELVEANYRWDQVATRSLKKYEELISRSASVSKGTNLPLA